MSLNPKDVKVGDMVYVEILDIDEIEVTCWLCDYGCLGYFRNTHQLPLSNKGQRYFLRVIDTTFEIRLLDSTKVPND